MIRRRTEPMTLLLAVAVLAVFAWGLARLVVFQIRQPDAYPLYSSFRSDPLGTRALHDSLALMPGRGVERNFGPIDRIPNPGRATLFVLGAGTGPGGPAGFTEEAEALRAFVRAGGRLVWVVRPLRPATSAAPEREVPAAEHDACCGEGAGRGGAAWAAAQIAPGDGERLETADLHPDATAVGLPDQLPLHASAYVAEMDSAWRAIYTGASGPVVIERELGRGSMVLTTAYYLFSNEGLSRDRQPDFLAWCVGNAERILFDETRHGIVTSPGLAALVGRRLDGLIVGLLVLAALFIWRNSCALVPPDPAAERRESMAQPGRDAQAGLVHLLRRSIAATELPSVCMTEFERDLHRGDRAANRIEALRAEMAAEQARPPRKRDSVALYNRLAAHLQAGQHKQRRPHEN